MYDIGCNILHSLTRLSVIDMYRLIKNTIKDVLITVRVNEVTQPSYFLMVIDHIIHVVT